MNMDKELEDFFNDDNRLAHWTPLYFSPYSSSLERFNLGIAAYYKYSKDIHFKQILNRARLNTIFNTDYAQGIDGFYQTSKQSLEQYFADNGDLEQWVSPFGGVWLGTTGTSTAATLEAVADDGVMLSSILGSYGKPMRADKTKEDPKKNQLVDKIMKIAEQKHPGISRYAHKKFAKFDITVDLNKDNHWLNFCDITHHAQKAKAQLADLQVIKSEESKEVQTTLIAITSAGKEKREAFKAYAKSAFAPATAIIFAGDKVEAGDRAMSQLGA